jgi:hypothetical protein
VRHFYTAHSWLAPDVRERGIDLLVPIWHFMDLTPQGRGNWYASLGYGTKGRITVVPSDEPERGISLVDARPVLYACGKIDVRLAEERISQFVVATLGHWRKTTCNSPRKK